MCVQATELPVRFKRHIFDTIKCKTARWTAEDKYLKAKNHGFGFSNEPTYGLRTRFPTVLFSSYRERKKEEDVCPCYTAAGTF